MTVEELEAFLRFSIMMGVNHLLSLNDWSGDATLRYAPVRQIPGVVTLSTPCQYLFLEGSDGRPLLSTKFAEVYDPNWDLAVDD